MCVAEPISRRGIEPRVSYLAGRRDSSSPPGVDRACCLRPGVQREIRWMTRSVIMRAACAQADVADGIRTRECNHTPA